MMSKYHCIINTICLKSQNIYKTVEWDLVFEIFLTNDRKIKIHLFVSWLPFVFFSGGSKEVNSQHYILVILLILKVTNWNCLNQLSMMLSHVVQLLCLFLFICLYFSLTKCWMLMCFVNRLIYGPKKTAELYVNNSKTIKHQELSFEDNHLQFFIRQICEFAFMKLKVFSIIFLISTWHKIRHTWTRWEHIIRQSFSYKEQQTPHKKKTSLMVE